MHHLEASHLLTHYASGDLTPKRRKAVEEHISCCVECTGWIATYSLFTEALAEHPSSLELARFTLMPETLEPPSYDRCARHLEKCGVCRNEVVLVREAAISPQQEAERVQERNRGRLLQRRLAGAALAASMILALGVVLVSRTTHRSPVDYVLEGSTLHGEEKIVADRSILVETTEVAPGGTLTLESEIVAFGHGFSVKNGATLEVVTNKPIDEEDSSENT